MLRSYKQTKSIRLSNISIFARLCFYVDLERDFLRLIEEGETEKIKRESKNRYILFDNLQEKTFTVFIYEVITEYRI